MSGAFGNWAITEFRGRGGLAQLEMDWRRLYGELPRRTIFHSFEAAVAHVENCMAAPERLRCLRLDDGLRARAICLLAPREERRLVLPVQAWAPLRFHDHLNDFLCPDEVARRALAPALVAHLRRNPEGLPLLALGPVPVDSELWDGVCRLGHGDPCIDPRGVVCGLDCSMPYDKLMTGVPRHFRRVLALARNRLAPLRDVHYVTAREPAELQAEWRNFLEVEASGWKGDDSSAVRCRPGQAQFYLALAMTLRGPADFCEVTALYADGRCIASTFGTRTGSTYSMLKICYDEAYGRVSPGQLLLAKVIERCCGDPGIDRVDFVSDAYWLRGWQILSVPVKLAYLNIGGLRGRVILSLLKVRFGLLRRIAHWLGPKLGKVGVPVPERT